MNIISNLCKTATSFAQENIKKGKDRFCQSNWGQKANSYREKAQKIFASLDLKNRKEKVLEKTFILCCFLEKTWEKREQAIADVSLRFFNRGNKSSSSPKEKTEEKKVEKGPTVSKEKEKENKTSVKPSEENKPPAPVSADKKELPKPEREILKKELRRPSNKVRRYTRPRSLSENALPSSRPAGKKPSEPQILSNSVQRSKPIQTGRRPPSRKRGK